MKKEERGFVTVEQKGHGRVGLITVTAAGIRYLEKTSGLISGLAFQCRDDKIHEISKLQTEISGLETASCSSLNPKTNNPSSSEVGSKTAPDRPPGWTFSEGEAETEAIKRAVYGCGEELTIVLRQKLGRSSKLPQLERIDALNNPPKEITEYSPTAASVSRRELSPEEKRRVMEEFVHLVRAGHVKLAPGNTVLSESELSLQRQEPASLKIQ